MRVFLPRSCQPADHYIESVLIGSRDLVKEKGSVIEVFKINDSDKKEVGFLYKIYQHLSVNLLHCFCGRTFFQEG